MLNKKQIILQPTSFCNIDCKYCYLPSRNNAKHMSHEVMERIFTEILKSDYFDDPIRFVWHLGEPLSVSPKFYEQAFALLDSINQQYNRKFVHGIQTNATLINNEWVELFRQHNVKIGVSLDGPEFIHNRNRITREGYGTHAKTMRGIRLLQEGGIQPDIIAVLTFFSLDYPDEIFNFFVENKIVNIGFNIDEIEGVNINSSYIKDGAVEKYKQFMERLILLTDESLDTINVREFSQFVPIFLHQSNRIGSPLNSTNSPMHLLTFDYKGNFSTFSPELLGSQSDAYHNFVMGNIMNGSIDKIFTNPVFLKVNAEIKEGVQACKNSCTYWTLCGGGFPSNKFFEHHRFDVTETTYCRVHKKALADVVLKHFENKAFV